MLSIKELRKRTGLTQSAFAIKYKIPQRSLQNWEYGKRKCSETINYLLERVVRTDYPSEFCDDKEEN